MAYINKTKIYFAGISKGISERYTDGVIVEDIEPEVSLISFTVDGTSYQAEEGMTWGEWVESEYNTVGATVVYSNIIINDAGVTGVISTDIITSGGSYTTSFSGGA